MTPRQRQRVRVGILGCAEIVRRKLLPALLASEHATLTAVASRCPERAAALAPGVDYRCHDYAGLLDEPDVELVYIALPNHLHEEWAIRALRAGKDVICEKPLGLSVAAVERMLAVAESEGRLLYENLMFLHHPQHARVRELLDAGAIGALIELRCVFTFPEPAAGNIRLVPEWGGGALHDLNRYPLAAADYLLRGTLREFRGFATTRERLNLGVHGTARSTRGEICSYSIAFGGQYQSGYEILGSTGLLRLERAFTPPPELENRIVLRCGTTEELVPVAAADQFRLMLDQVCGLLRADRDFTACHARSRRLARLAARLEKGCCVHA